MPGGILRRAPGDATSLRGDHDDFGSLLEEAAVDEGRTDPKWTTRANINRFELNGKIQVLQCFEFLHEEASIVNELLPPGN